MYNFHLKVLLKLVRCGDRRTLHADCVSWQGFAAVWLVREPDVHPYTLHDKNNETRPLHHVTNMKERGTPQSG